MLSNFRAWNAINMVIHSIIMIVSCLWNDKFGGLIKKKRGKEKGKEEELRIKIYG